MMLRNFVRVLLSVLALLLAAETASAQRISNPDLHTRITQAIELSGRQKYAAAEAAFDDIIRDFPGHPAGYLNKAILLQVMSLDFETPVRMPDFLTLLERSETLANTLLASPGTSMEGRYHLGMAKSYRAYYNFRDGENWISGLSYGMKASSELEECLDMDPTAYDAMTGVGTYRYWKSRNMSFLTWTPLVDDERRSGIGLLRIAERKASYTAAQATNSLVWIYIEEEQYEDAIRAAKRMLRIYPKHRLFLWGLASAAEQSGRWSQARDAYRSIIASVDDEVSEARYITIQARAKIALMSHALEDNTTALQECRWVLRHRGIDLRGFTDDGKSRIENRIVEMEELLEELQTK